jgi:hypothetical protein
LKTIVVICEGKTEVQFVKAALCSYTKFSSRFIFHYVTLPTGEQKGGGSSKGGWRSSNGYAYALNEIKKVLINFNDDCVVTTLFDLYGFPSDIPCYMEAQLYDPISKASKYEQQMRSDISSIVGFSANFHPYIQPYEFEALMFSNPEITARMIASTEQDAVQMRVKMEVIMESFPSPEHINGKYAPSKRLEEIIPNFKKNKAGRAGYSWMAAKEIGIPELRQKCSNFNEWIEMMETFG